MNIIRFLEFLGSVGIFIYGLKIMSEGLQKVAGQGLQKLFSVIADNRFLGFFSGILITALIQSSSAITVMLVSFVNLGVLSLTQSIGVIMGANIGTTLTSWIVALVGFTFDMTHVFLPIVGLAIPLLFSGIRKWKSLGEFLIGFCLLFLGLQLMKSNFPNISEHPEALGFIAQFANYGIWSPIIFILIGLVLTVIIQSSSAALSITIVMVSQGYIPFNMAAGLILGGNLGTTITAFLASLVGNEDAKRASLVHILFNVLGVILVLCFYQPFLMLVDSITVLISKENHSIFSTINQERKDAMPLAVAVFHTLFNVINSIVFIGFIKQFVIVCQKIIPDSKYEIDNTEIILGKNLIDTPEIAVLEARNALGKLSTLYTHLFTDVKMFLFDEFHDKDELYIKIKTKRDELKIMEFEVTKFLKDVAQANTSEESSNKIVNMLRMISDFERIGTVIWTTTGSIKNKHENRILFKRNLSSGLEELSVLVEQAFAIMVDNLSKNEKLISVQEFNVIESEINILRDKLRIKHLQRIGKKKDILEEGLVFREIYSSFEKIADHIYNINEALIRRK